MRGSRRRTERLRTMRGRLIVAIALGVAAGFLCVYAIRVASSTHRTCRDFYEDAVQIHTYIAQAPDGGLSAWAPYGPNTPQRRHPVAYAILEIHLDQRASVEIPRLGCGACVLDVEMMMLGQQADFDLREHWREIVGVVFATPRTFGDALLSHDNAEFVERSIVEAMRAATPRISSMAHGVVIERHRAHALVGSVRIVDWTRWALGGAILLSAVGVLVLGWVAISVGRKLSRVRRGRCFACGYDMRGVESLICPECGAEQPVRERVAREVERA